MSSYTIVGVVGHIDHGKTALVKALTGTDTDTHPEEKQRGITIDLGFASYQTGDDEFALIDAPGHHKYLGNLLAGVSSVDVGLLVVAADQGIQAQTIEHTAILNALGVPKLIVVMSRIDLCQRETLPELEEELCVFLSDYGFADFPVLPLSVRTGEGLEELKQELSQMARQEERNHHGSFRLPIDRVFSVEGRGCVVAGTIGSGSVSVGDSLQVVGGPTVRVRELEVHSQHVESSRAGRRTAINLASVTAKELRRGDELIASEAFEPLRHFLMEVTLFPDAQEVASPAQAQIHTGTSSCSARLSSSKAFLAKKPVVALVETERSIIGVYDQKCLFRRPDPIGAFAGGQILAAIRPEIRRSHSLHGLLQFGEKLQTASPTQRLAAWIDFFGEIAVSETWRTTQFGLSAEEFDALVAETLQGDSVFQLGESRLVSRRFLKEVQDRILNVLKARTEHQQSDWLSEAALLDAAKKHASAAVAEMAIQELLKDKALIQVNRLIARASDADPLSKKQKAKLEELVKIYEETARTPPSISAAAEWLEITEDAAASLTRFLVAQGFLVDIGQKFLFTAGVIRQLQQELAELLDAKDSVSVAEVRDRWEVTRKHAIPLLEFFDEAGITKRKGTERVPGPNFVTGAEKLNTEPGS